ncbi:hypothetical protein E4U57_008110, partial [Claviceps arundinis]
LRRLASHLFSKQSTEVITHSAGCGQNRPPSVSTTHESNGGSSMSDAASLWQRRLRIASVTLSDLLDCM